MEQKKLVSFSALFRESIAMYRARFRTFLAIAALPAIFFMIGGGVSEVKSAPAYGIGSIFFLVGIVLYLLSSAALFYAIKENLGFRDAYRAAWKNIWGYSWVSFLAIAAVTGGFILFVIPGFIFSMWFAFAVMVCIFEGRKGMEALMVSREYVRGYWWQVFWRTMGAGIALGIVSSLIQAPAYLFGTAVGGLWQSVVECVFAPLYLLYTYRLYVALRTAKGGAVTPSSEGRDMILFTMILPVIVPVALLLAALMTGRRLF